MGVKREGRAAPLDMDAGEFRELGHRLVDDLANFLAGWDRPVTHGESPAEIRALLGAEPLPERGAPAGALLEEATALLSQHSLFNGHPRFLGYITSGAAPIGMLGDFLAAAMNPNVGSFRLSPMATEIEAQTVRWIADLIGFPAGGGLLVSGGNMANFVGFLAGRKAMTPWDVRAQGTGVGRLRVYSSAETHTWIQKAADLFGLGTEAVRSIPVDARQRMRMEPLREAIASDGAHGDHPAIVVGTAGTVSTGAVDPLREIADLCAAEKLWFHVDGAYGGFAAALPGASDDLKALSRADSVAVDPHKWLYAPLEAGCALVRDAGALRDAFAYHPPYYHFDAGDDTVNYYELGLQNSRGFRALKVWLGLRRAGREGIVRMIADDCDLADELFNIVSVTPELEPGTRELSITTFRYVPKDLAGRPEAAKYLNALNEAIVERMQAGGEAFVSNAIVAGRYLLRSCVVNFRTTRDDIAAIPPLVVRLGREADAALRPEALR
jgi:glutamate/tyrosine decarboxylase-like PLP-dependent enzyme